jgi:hypothetical protein
MRNGFDVASLHYYIIILAKDCCFTRDCCYMHSAASQLLAWRFLEIYSTRSSSER